MLQNQKIQESVLDLYGQWPVARGELDFCRLGSGPWNLSDHRRYVGAIGGKDDKEMPDRCRKLFMENDDDRKDIFPGRYRMGVL